MAGHLGRARVGYRRCPGRAGSPDAGCGRYREETLGQADDTLPANGADVLDFRRRKRRRWRGPPVPAGLQPGWRRNPPRRRQALHRGGRRSGLPGRHAGPRRPQPRDHPHRHRRPHLPRWARVPVARLTRDKVRAWHRALSTAPARARGRPVEADPADADAPRRRQATANRILTILKAALNHAREEGRAPAPMTRGGWSSRSAAPTRPRSATCPMTSACGWPTPARPTSARW